MLPSELQPAQFSFYSPEARKLVLDHLAALRQLPITFLPSLLREIIEYDFKFPAERASIDKELSMMDAMTTAQIKALFGPFVAISLSDKLMAFDWINQPARFVEQQSAYLWSTHQLDAFTKAATEYGAYVQSSLVSEPPPVKRLGIAVIGQGVTTYDEPLFRNLRAQGTYFTHLKPENGLQLLLDAVTARSQAHPTAFAHWYVDGGQEAEHSPTLAAVSYQAMQPMRSALLKSIQAQIERPGMGPEELRTYLARLAPADVAPANSADGVLDRFKLKILTEGSGTQIFSTTFAQWTTREALRRAQPLTLLVRYAPRQRQRPMNELLANTSGNGEVDLIGSLIDADMGAYYHWINQQRLSGADQSVFLVWFEAHSQALVVSPSLPRGTQSTSAIDLGQLVSLALA